MQVLLHHVFLAALIALARGQSTFSWDGDISKLVEKAEGSSFFDILDRLHDSSGGSSCPPNTKFIGTADPSNPSCFFLSLCHKPGLRLRGCCTNGGVYVGPTASDPLGTCLPANTPTRRVSEFAPSLTGNLADAAAVLKQFTT